MIEKINLNYDWKYNEKFTKEALDPSFDDTSFEAVNIPHTNKEIPFNDFNEEMYQFVSVYRKHVTIDKKLKGKKLILEFEAVANAADVYVNGKLAFSHKGSYTAFKGDITDLVEYGEDNVIAVKVDSTEREDIPPFGNIVDYLVYGGIYREVYIYVHEQEYIKEYFLTPLDVLTEPKIGIKATFSKLLNNKPVDIIIKQNGNVVTKKTLVVMSDSIDEEFPIKDAKLWDIDNPNLYDVDIIIDKDVVSDRVGLRECKFTKKGFFLNGKKIMLRGLNRHQSFPYVGNAMPKSAQIADADFLKYHLGVNLVRTSHYPNSKHFLNRCDEIGLLVFTEIPGWQFISQKEEWRNVCLQHVEEMVTQDYNHPSIVVWGVRINESPDDDELYKKTNEIAHKLDQTRQTTGVRFFPKSHLLEDVYSYNDFIHSGNNAPITPKFIVTGLTKPLIISEHNGHMYPTKTFDHENKRLEHALRHARVVNAAYKSKGHSAVIGWCMSDYNTHKDFGSGDKICYHGVTDMFRMDKLAAYTYRIQQDLEPVLQLSSNMEIGDVAGSNLGKVYIFTNCEEIKMYKNGVLINTFDVKKEAEKSEFKYLPHPLISLDDVIGNQIENDNEFPFTKGEAAAVKKALLDTRKYGAVGAGARNFFTFIKMVTKYHISLNKMTELYRKFVTAWGDKQVSYKFEGYINGEKVAETEKGAVTTPKLFVKADKDTLIEDETYDVVRIQIQAQSQYGNVLPYDSSVISVETSNNIEVIGPKTFALIGGQRAIWVKTKGLQGKATIKITSDNFETKQIEIKVEKK